MYQTSLNIHFIRGIHMFMEILKENSFYLKILLILKLIQIFFQANLDKRKKQATVAS